MKMKHFIENGIIAIIRGHQPEDIPAIIEALEEGGIHTVEITADTPKFAHVLEQVSHRFSERIWVGAGTVLDPETARIALLSGAKFILSPSLNVETITLTKRYGAISIPGAFTPTEILTAYEQGADAVKVYPSSVLGPAYIKAIRDPLPQVPLIPTGGVDLENMADYLRSGAIAVGIGGSLVTKTEKVDSSYLQELKQKASRYVAAIKKVKN